MKPGENEVGTKPLETNLVEYHLETVYSVMSLMASTAVLAPTAVINFARALVGEQVQFEHDELYVSPDSSVIFVRNAALAQALLERDPKLKKRIAVEYADLHIEIAVLSIEKGSPFESLVEA